MKKIKQFVTGLFAFAVTALVITGCSTTYKELQASLPDLSDKEDGIYRGFFSVSGTPVKVTVDVVIKENKIDAVNIVRHVCSPIGKKAAKITVSVTERQSLDIDVVSGATGSSKGILKAIENALQ
jgi:uncharacterized protein with FMN-binding domain